MPDFCTVIDLDADPMCPACDFIDWEHLGQLGQTHSYLCGGCRGVFCNPPKCDSEPAAHELTTREGV